MRINFSFSSVTCSSIGTLAPFIGPSITITINAASELVHGLEKANNTSRIHPMTNVLDGWQTEDLVILERTTSIFSIVGCIFIFATFLSSCRFRRPINRLIFYASWGNLLMNVATLMSVTPTSLPDPKQASLCRFQGFLIQMFLPADALWNVSIAINVYLTVFKRWDAARLKRLEPLYILFNYGVTFAVAFTYLFIDDDNDNGWGRGRVYGPANLWCWIDKTWDGFRIWLCYAPAWACIAVIFFIYTLAWVDIFHKRRSFEGASYGWRRATKPTTQLVLSTQEVRITTEIKHTSFHTPLSSPFHGRMPEVISKRIFNPFSLDPTYLRGYDPYSITIERGEHARDGTKHTAAAEANAAAWAYTRTALLYFASLLITWLPSSINRVYSLVYKDQVSFPFSVMAGLVLPLQGFWNSVIYVVTSWDAVLGVLKDEMLRERGAALIDRQAGMRSEDATWIEIVSVKNTNMAQPSFEANANSERASARGFSDTRISRHGMRSTEADAVTI